jgi:Arc/MetJ family transcription regulator
MSASEAPAPSPLPDTYHLPTLDIREADSDIREAGVMAKTLIDIDEELLAQAAVAFGTKTKKGTVNAALRDSVERKRRAVALARLGAMADAGDFDILLDKKNYRR